MGGRRRDPRDSNAGVSEEDGVVLGECDAPGGVAHRVEICVARASVDVLELRPLERELGAVFDEGLHVAQPSADAGGGTRRRGDVGAGGDALLISAGPREVDEAPGREEMLERPRRFLVDLAPRRLGDGRQLPE